MEQAQEDAVLEQAQEGAVLEQAQEGAVLEQAQEVAVLEQAQEGAVLEQAQDWMWSVAGLGEPRTTAGWFWLGAGHSPDTGGSPPSSIVPWCLGGPWDDGNCPRARTERGWWRHLMPSPRQVRKTPANTRGKGDLGGQGR